MLKDFTELTVWQKSMDLVVEIYGLTKALPADELYGLVSQMRRAAVSISSNIAEGYSRPNKREYIRYLTIAMGSKSELQTQLLICERVNYLTKAQTKPALSLCSEIGKMLNAMAARLREQDGGIGNRD